MSNDFDEWFSNSFLDCCDEAELLKALKCLNEVDTSPFDSFEELCAPTQYSAILSRAAFSGWDDVIRYMFFLGLSSDEIYDCEGHMGGDDKDRTALGVAAACGHYHTVKMLVEELGVKIDGPCAPMEPFLTVDDINPYACDDSDGGAGLEDYWGEDCTPLGHALMNKHYLIARFLLENGADPYLADPKDSNYAEFLLGGLHYEFIDGEGGDEMLKRINAELQKEAKQRWAKVREQLRVLQPVCTYLFQQSMKAEFTDDGKPQMIGAGARRARAEYDSGLY